MSPTITLRPVEPSDEAFLLLLYTGTRDDVNAAPWPPEERDEFVRMQFEAQRGDYTSRFPDAEHSIILVDGDPHGRIWIDRRPNEIRLLDIALLPEMRNRGTGRIMLDRLIAEARAVGTPLRHSVYRDNVAALRFYERLGFGIVEDFEMYVLMEWLGEDAASSSSG